MSTATDILLIGTSPIVLCHALRYAQSGRRIAIFDKSPVPGGAWHTPPIVGAMAVESGVHLIENRRAVYQALTQLEVSIQVETASFGIFHGHRLPLAFARALSFGGVLAKSALRLDRDGMTCTTPRFLRSIRNIRTPFKYPVLGAGGITESLLEQLAAFGIRPNMATTVQDIQLRSGVRGGVCVTSKGTVEFQSACMASRAHAIVHLDGRSLHHSTKKIQTTCLVVRVPARNVRAFDYVEILFDPALRRVRDVSKFVTPPPDCDERVLCFQCRTERGKPLLHCADIARMTIDRAASFGLLDRDTVILDAQLDRFTYETLNNQSLAQLEAAHPDLHCIRSTDFGEDLLHGLSASEPSARDKGLATNQATVKPKRAASKTDLV